MRCRSNYNYADAFHGALGVGVCNGCACLCSRFHMAGGQGERVHDAWLRRPWCFLSPASRERFGKNSMIIIYVRLLLTR